MSLALGLFDGVIHRPISNGTYGSQYDSLMRVNCSVSRCMPLDQLTAVAVTIYLRTFQLSIRSVSDVNKSLHSLLLCDVGFGPSLRRPSRISFCLSLGQAAREGGCTISLHVANPLLCLRPFICHLCGDTRRCALVSQLEDAELVGAHLQRQREERYRKGF